MSAQAIDANARPAIGRGFRLQWEPSQRFRISPALPLSFTMPSG